MAERKLGQQPIGNNSQVQFLHGEQAKLDTIIKNKSGQSGAFYFADDSRRLYMGLNDNSVVPVNDSVIKVASVSNLPATFGDYELVAYGPEGSSVSTFYYAIAENVLCVYHNGSWKQINPDTFNKYKTTTAEPDSRSTGTTRYDITDVIGDNKNQTVQSSWALETDGTISLTLTEESTSSDDATITYNKPVFKFKSTTYLKTNEQTSHGEFQLVNAASNSQIIKINGDSTNGIAVTSDNAGNINLNADALYKKLHDVDIASFTMGATSNAGFDSDGNLTTTFTRENGAEDLTQTITPIIAYGNNRTAKFVSNTATLNVYDKTQIDSMMQDAKEAINAMSYKGVTPETPNCVSQTINGTSYSVFYPADQENETYVEIGDTWKIGGGGKGTSRYTTHGYYIEPGQTLPAGEKWARVGDLLIANGEEDNNGHIPGANIRWDYVESGDDDNNIYKATIKSHGFEIQEESEKAQPIILDFTLNAGSQIVLEDTEPKQDDGTTPLSPEVKIVTIKHESLSRTDSVADVQTQTSADVDDYTTLTQYTLVTGIETHTNGHIKAVTTTPINFVDTNASLESVSIGATTTTGVTNNKSVTLTTSTQLQHPSNTNYGDDKQSDTMIIATEHKNIEITATTNNDININFVWGTF